MILTNEQAKQYYRLWIPLLDYVNRKYRIVKALYGMTSPEGLPISKVALISQRLWENREIIDEYLALEGKGLNAEETALVGSWKRAVHGRFIVERHLQKGSVLICAENEEVYIVKGIYSTWREMMHGYPMPQAVRTTLIPFGDAIIYDGVLAPYGVCFGKNASDELKAVYHKANKSGNLHYSL